jgi:hypothetical protein
MAAIVAKAQILGVIKKPWNPQELRDEITKYLGEEPSIN